MFTGIGLVDCSSDKLVQSVSLQPVGLPNRNCHYNLECASVLLKPFQEKQTAFSKSMIKRQ